ncbi:MAG: phenylalanine--tRNA ligase subunit beta [Actinomycetota bacterium]|nr:phenylalanine--tRNA ligase subunit beta [Actinomycetota bacterium]
MRVPIEWLHEYCRPDLDAGALAERLAMTGTEVERVEHHGVGAVDRFVVGRVLEARPHPDADRLRVCIVDVGEAQPAQIICGAPNVSAGQTVAVARPGAVMPDGSRLKAAKLRGQTSEGMILAEDEVAIGPEHHGIMVLEHDGLIPGAPLGDVLPIATDVLELEITSNRPDCLGVYGVAREVHAATGAPLAPPPWAQDSGSDGPLDAVQIEVECPDLCPRFTARAFAEVHIAPSPRWLKARLMAAGQRPISNVVDITNYVMLLTGQPLHAFDLDRTAGGRLTIRRARPGEQVQTLDGQARSLTEDMVLIADGEGPTSIAGVMGGARSEVQAQTTRVLMEAANWNGANIHRTSLTLGLRSEASGRFEKQLQPEQAMDAQALATELMVALCGARALPGTIDIGGPGPPPATIRLRDARITGLLGIEVPRARCAEILTALEFETADAEDGLDVTVPAFRRGDVTREADLIEEVARLGALEDLPATLPANRYAVGAGHGASGRLTGQQQLRRRASDALAAQGLHETVGWSFSAPELAARLRLPERPVVALANPMSREQAQLRTTLLGGLLDAARRNRARGMGAIRVFEAGAVYLPGERRQPEEPYRLAALLTGPVRPSTWREQSPPMADFFAAKGVLGGLLGALRAPWSVQASEPEPFLHPGRAADVLVAGRRAGWLGEIHPQVAADWDFTAAVAGFEIDFEPMAAAVADSVYRDVTSYPEVREDLAVIVPETAPAAEVVDVALRAGQPLLTQAEVFDVYRDPERIGPGNVSLALRLTFQAGDRTLTDEEVAAKRRKVSAALAEQLGGRFRDA